jgi:putative lipoic acid-binding regulatory protein
MTQIIDGQSPVTDLIFPCEYPVKVIGPDEDHFFEFVVELVSRHVPGLSAEKFSTRRSSSGKYMTVSVTFIADSRPQVDALYKELGQHPRVKVAF